MTRFFLKLFLRNFRKHWVFNLINLLGLIIGLSIAIIIGSWVHYHLTFNHSLKNADRLFRIVQHLHHDQTDEWVAPTPTPLAEALLQAYPEISKACRIHPSEDLIIRANQKSFSEDRVIFADPSLFDMFSFEFITGRDFRVPAMNEIMISESTAKKYFDSGNPVGKLMEVEDHNLIVAGVFRDLPSDSHFDFQVVLPLNLAIELHHEVAPDTWNPYDEIETYIKTIPGADQGKLSQKIAGFKSRFIENSKDELVLQSVKKIHTQTYLNHDIAKTISPATLFIFSTVAVFLLIVATGNFFIFTIAQSSRRRKETAIRRINGSSVNSILIGQILDSFLLVILSIILTLVLIELSGPVIREVMEIPQTGSFLSKPEIYTGLIMVVIFISLAGGLVNGTGLSKIRPNLLFGSQVQHPLHGSRLLRSLVILQFAISLSMLIFAFAIHSQLQFINTKEVGFDKDRLISVKLFDESKMKLFNDLEQFMNELKSNTAIQDVTFSCSSPAIINTSAGEADWDGKAAGESLTVQWNSIFYNYFNTIGVDLVAGRNFSENFENEIGEENYAVYILNESAVKGMNLSNEDVLGRNFELYGRKGPVIGVVKDFHFQSLREKIQPMAFDMLPWWYNEIIVRTTTGAVDPLNVIEQVYHKYFPSAPFQFTFVTDQYEGIYITEKKLLSYNSLLALFMIVISALGLSSLAFLMVESRTKEIGIRKINGATINDIFILLAGYFGRWIFLAILIAVPASFIIIRQWFGNYEYKTGLHISFFLIPILLIICISLLSIVTQVIKASKTNPVETLRHE